MKTRCFVLIKPLGMDPRILPKILKRLMEIGSLVAQRSVQANETDIKALYSISGHDQNGKELPHFEPMVKYLTGKNLLVLVLEGDSDIIETINALVGPWQCHAAANDQLRYLPIMMGLDYRIEVEVSGRTFICTDNLIHSSDSAESADREILIWFPEIIRSQYL